MTSDTLPSSVDYIVRQVRRAAHPSWWVVVVRDGIEYDQLALSYASDPQLAWARPRMFGALGVVDPAVDLAAYYRTRWWRPGWEASHTAAELLEDAAGPELIEPWPHEWLLDPPA